jgi:hypothetical protein
MSTLLFEVKPTDVQTVSPGFGFVDFCRAPGVRGSRASRDEGRSA